MNRFTKYRLLHPERVKESKHKHYLKNKDRLNAQRRLRYLEEKEHSNELSRQWYLRHKEYRKEYTRKYRNNNKKLFADYKDQERFSGNKQTVFDRDKVCLTCGVAKSTNNKPLIIHHIDGSGKEKTPNNQLENLITLCSRCHHHLHRYQTKHKTIFQSIEDIVRTMAKVIEEYRKVHPIPRNWKSNK